MTAPPVPSGLCFSFLILLHLFRHKLLNTIWGYEFDGASRTVDVHIRTLRQKLGRSGDCIETVRGVGYKISTDDQAGNARRE